ncbi:early transcribed membrane protein [Plasmodium gonderi]|uniref:Early transcribed membrane protein n=1 Tax=Plasmodium gonderi TaxID=77519 RepID=A0A1Y1JQJ2_PLAGO|nr:early transcribed membrane protein [Plasmodium gonderi]GAW82723.1 early transcribed membrane protein [Plasmodium gonderi]
MKITKVHIPILILLFCILFEYLLCNDVAKKSNLLHMNATLKSLIKKDKKNVLLIVVSVMLAVLPLVLAGLGIHYKRKKPSFWDDLGYDAHGILNSTISQGVWIAKKNMTKDRIPIDKLLPRIDDIKSIIKEELEYRKLDINRYDALQIQDLCNFSLYNIRESMLSFQRNA